MAAIKLYPATLRIWLLAQGRRDSIVGLVAGAIGAGRVSLAGAGLGLHLRNLEIMRGTAATGASELSLAGLAESAGTAAELAIWLPVACLVAGSILTIATRWRPDVSFAVAVFTMVAGSSVVNINTPSLLLAVLAPLAWPLSLDAHLSSTDGTATLLADLGRTQANGAGT